MLRNRFYFCVSRRLPTPSSVVFSYNHGGVNPPNDPDQRRQ
jgi:hypothetical protein